MHELDERNAEGSEPAQGNAGVRAGCIVAAIGAALVAALGVAVYLWIQSAAGFVNDLQQWKLPL